MARRCNSHEVLIEGECIPKSILGIPNQTRVSSIANKRIAEILLNEHYQELKDAYDLGQRYYRISNPIRAIAIPNRFTINYEATKKYREIEDKADKMLREKIIKLLRKHNISPDEVRLSSIEMWIVARLSL